MRGGVDWVAPPKLVDTSPGRRTARYCGRLANLQRIHIVPACSHTVAVQVILIALGGALGSVCRYGLTIAVQRLSPPTFPYGTFVVNVLGCLVFGMLVGAARHRIVLGQAERAFLFVGVLGGFTTFSTFAYDVFALLQTGELFRAAMNAAGQLLGGVTAIWAGYVIASAL